MSWALPKGLPAPGEKRLAVPQPVHDYAYKDFTGTINEGYGKGTVKPGLVGNALVTKNTPEKLDFSLIDSTRPERYTLITTKGGQLALNTTPQTADPVKKEHYKTIYQNRLNEYLDKGYALSPKLDGAQQIVTVHPDKLEVTSIRPGADNKPIVHTERIGGLTGLKVPEDLVGQQYRAELIGERGGRAIPLQELSGLLNSRIYKSIKDRAGSNTSLRLYGFDKLSGEPDFRSRNAALQKAIKLLHNPALAAAPVLYARKAQDQLVKDVKSEAYPLTSEGFVLTDPDKPGATPIKAPITPESDVLIEDIIAAKTKDGSKRAGALRYSLPETPGKIVGNVGSGIDRKLGALMLENRDDYIGRIARILSKGQYPSGAYRAPVFKTLHEG